MYSRRIIFLVSLAAPLAILGLVWAESTFTQLHLSPDGVYAVDSSGREWEYDFSKDKFVQETGVTSGTQTVFGREARASAEEIDSIRPMAKDQLQEELDKAQAEAEALKGQAEALREEYSNIKRIKGLQLGRVEIGPDERVEGTVVSVGPIIIKGLVEGDVISYKRITVTSTGQITGDARAPEIVKMRGGIISGRRYETDLPQIPDIKLFEETSYTGLAVNVIIFAILLFSGFLTVAVLPRPLNRMHLCLNIQFLKSFLIGFVAWILIGPAFALLCLTIIGIPVAIFILPLALILAVLLGSLAMAQLVGEKIDGLLGSRYKSQLLHMVAGLIILYFLWIMMSVFNMTPSPASRTLGTLFMVVAIIIWSVGVTAGIGAVIITRYGSRECEKRLAPPMMATFVPPTPPPPTPPPLKSD